MTKIINSKFLPNAPKGEDLFKNKSQDKIAKVIAEKVINDPDFKIIGIDGEWGSGKSNLVKLIENKLTNTHVFFIYDVWGHQEDDQRHSILTEITDFITTKKVIKENSNWVEKLQILTSKQKNTTTTNIPHLSIGFILSLLLIIYVPTVNTFAKNLDLKYQIPLVLLPILLLFSLFIKFYLKSFKLGKTNNHINLTKWGMLKKYGREAAQELFKVYHSQKEAETKIEVISEKEPSVKEFRSWMKDIDDDLNKNVVIVFDNFDRLPKKHILSIWSSIHIFFAEDPYKNIKVIIPFDREHIQNAFKELNSGLDNKFGDDYVNKTFDIVFRVTLPIMSDWKQFFENQWKKAFTNFYENELRLVIQAYEFLNRRITPREIISFINEILAIKLLDEKFKERYIAIFVLKKDEILKDPLLSITNLEYLKGLKSFYQSDSEYAKQLTAIVYHIEIDNALELIYTQELRDSLNKNDIEQFNIICNSEFIDSIFDSAISDLEILENPIKTLSQLENDSNLSELHIRQAWDLFYDKVLSNRKKIEKLEIEDWQVILLRNHSDNRYLSFLLDGYLDVLDDTNPLTYIALIDDLFENVDFDRVSNLMSEKEIVPKNFIEMVEGKEDEYQQYKLTTTGLKLDEYLSKLPIEDILKLRNTYLFSDEYPLTKYKVFLKTNLNTYVDQNNIQFANDVILKLKETSKKDTGLKDLLSDARIYNLFTNNSSSDLPIINELIAMRIAKGNKFEASYNSTFQTVLNAENKKRADEVVLTILNYVNYSDLLLSSKYFKTSELFRQIILKMFARLDLEKKADILKLIANYEEIKTSLGFDDDKLLEELNKWEVDKSKLDIDKLDDKFIEDCYQYDELNISKSFSEKFNDDFKNFSEKEYGIIFGDGSDVHFRYFNKLNFDSLTQTSLDVFEKQIIDKFKEDKIEDQWWIILQVYDSNNDHLAIVNSLKNIRDLFINGNIELHLEIAMQILPYFLKYDLLNPNTDIFRTIIKNGFMVDERFIDLLLLNADHLKALYQNSAQAEKESFRNIVNEKRATNEKLERLAKSIGIRKPKDKEEN